jgi:hypothetical protein
MHPRCRCSPWSYQFRISEREFRVGCSVGTFARSLYTRLCSFVITHLAFNNGEARYRDISAFYELITCTISMSERSRKMYWPPQTRIARDREIYDQGVLIPTPRNPNVDNNKKRRTRNIQHVPGYTTYFQPLLCCPCVRCLVCGIHISNQKR